MAQQPRQQLPITTRPTVLTCRGNVIACGELFNDLDVGSKARAREHAFKQIMTEHGVFRYAVFERRFHRIQIVDAFTGE